MLDSTTITKPKTNPASTSPKWRGAYHVRIDAFGNVNWLSVPGERKLKPRPECLRAMLKRLRRG